MANTYYVRVRGRVLGPYTLDRASQMAKKAQIGRSHEMSLDGEAWCPASEFPEIFDRSLGTPDVPSQLMPPFGGQYPPGAAVPQANPAPTGPLWYYTLRGQQQTAAIPESALINLIATGQVGADDHVWCETMASWDVVSRVPRLASFALPSAPAAADAGSQAAWPVVHRTASASADSPEYRAFVGKKTGAGMLALFFGCFGVHKFMLGLTTGGLTMLILCVLIFPIPLLSIVSFVEAVIYLSKSDDSFYQEYAVQKKQWF
jgi:TM2 domain-containing membrane protein YozV